MKEHKFIYFEPTELIMSFNPIDLMKKFKISIEFPDKGLIVNEHNWPKNLVLNKKLFESDDMFYEQFSSDSTLSFYIKSSMERVMSLISRAISQPEKLWEHGYINIYEIPKVDPSPYMVRTRTNLALQEIS